jgi:hypothetical protein
MPNWCNNFVQIRHEDQSKLQALAEAVNAGRFCESIVPVPAELREHSAPEYDEARAEDFRNRFGYADWYSFCVSRWGTKWDVEPYDPTKAEDGLVSFGFDSAWAPPIAIYEALIEQGFQVDAMYYEPGMGFCGRWVDGSDDYYNICDMTADEVANEIDSDIDEQFGISENMAEWEEENKETEDE